MENSVVFPSSCKLCFSVSANRFNKRITLKVNCTSVFHPYTHRVDIGSDSIAVGSVCVSVCMFYAF